MTDKLPQLNFQQGMQIWREKRLSESGQEGEHIAPAKLAKLAFSTGLADSDEAIIEHLASCPKCLGMWAAACRESADFTAPEAADDWYTGGMLEAAASEESGQPIALPSQCGHFMLRIFPEAEDATRGMVALEVTGAVVKSKVEGSQVTVRDTHGEVLLEGKLIAGRVARMMECLTDFDLQSWSLVVHQQDTTDHVE